MQVLAKRASNASTPRPMRFLARADLKRQLHESMWHVRYSRKRSDDRARRLSYFPGVGARGISPVGPRRRVTTRPTCAVFQSLTEHSSERALAYERRGFYATWLTGWRFERRRAATLTEHEGRSRHLSSRRILKLAQLKVYDPNRIVIGPTHEAKASAFLCPSQRHALSLDRRPLTACRHFHSDARSTARSVVFCGIRIHRIESCSWINRLYSDRIPLSRQIAFSASLCADGL